MKSTEINGFVAGGNSQIAHFIKDANAQYIFGDNSESKSTPKSFEEVFSRAENAEFWVNVGNHKNKKDLLQINPLCEDESLPKRRYLHDFW